MPFSLLVVEERLGDDEIRSVIAIQDIFSQFFLESPLSSFEERGLDFSFGCFVLEILVSLVEEFCLAVFVDFDLGMIDTVGFLLDTIAFLVEGPGFELFLVGSLVFLQGVENGFS